MIINNSLIQCIESFQWKLFEGKVFAYEFIKSLRGNTYKLFYNDKKREWVMAKNGEKMFVGQDATPEEIMDVLYHLDEVIQYHP